MNEVRKVIGVLDRLVTNANGIAFPSVRVWVRGANDYVTHDLERLFPERGTIYLHVSACENQQPQRNQVGLFNCIESPGESAEWKVYSTSRQLAKVVECPIWERKPDQLAFWEWLLTFRDGLPCNILLSQGIVYVRRAKRELIGPFALSTDGKLVPREPVFLFENVDVVSLDVSGRKCGLFDTDLLPKGKPIVLDPREAIHRRLKLAAKTSQLEWLSRAKSQELSVALAGMTLADGSEWVMENLPHALESLALSGKLDEKLAEALLQIKVLEEALEAVWKKKHEDAVKKANEQIVELNGTAEGVRRIIGELKTQAAELESKKANTESELLDLDGKIRAAKLEAQKVFETELKRLAQTPETLALMGAWIGGCGKQPDRGRPLLRVQRAAPELRHDTNLKTALFTNLKACSLSPIVASEIAAACWAALVAGQPIAIRSIVADVLANAIASAFGQTEVLWVDVPAGLLDPIDWDDILPRNQEECVRILQHVNRSDIPLVLGSLHRGIINRALGIAKTSAVILLTLEDNAAMQVETSFPIAPIIDERMLRFTSGKVGGGLIGFPDYAKQLPEVMPISAEDFTEIGEALRQLSLFEFSAYESLYRRAYASLLKACEKPEDAPRLFFKYWCLPRCSSEEVLGILDEYKEKWAQDKVLVELKERLRGHE